MTDQATLGLLNTDDATLLVRRVSTVVGRALENRDIRSFIAQRRGTWSIDEVRRRAPANIYFELGELRGDLNELAGLMKYAKRRGLGAYIGFAPLRSEDTVSPYFTMILLAPDHPRRVRYEARASLKHRLGSQARVVTMALRLGTQERFIEWVRNQRGLSTTIRRRTGLTVKQLWRRAKGVAA